MPSGHDGGVPEASRAAYSHLLRRNRAEAVAFLFSERLSAALEPTVRHDDFPAASIEELRRLLAIKAFIGDMDGRKVKPTPFSMLLGHLLDC